MPALQQGTVSIDTLTQYFQNSVNPAITGIDDMMAVCVDINIPPGGTAVALPLPAGWTFVSYVQLWNLDTQTPVNVLLSDTGGTNLLNVQLPANGGMFAFGTYQPTIPGGNPLVDVTKIRLKGIDPASGTFANTYRATVRCFMAGYTVS